MVAFLMQVMANANLGFLSLVQTGNDNASFFEGEVLPNIRILHVCVLGNDVGVGVVLLEVVRDVWIKIQQQNLLIVLTVEVSNLHREFIEGENDNMVFHLQFFVFLLFFHAALIHEEQATA